jgi:hypothetical protein
MKRYLWIAAAVILPSFAACNRTVGECWPVGQADQSGGVGSGPVIASGGTGDNGDSPPNPNDFTIPEADCNIAEQSPCTEKCLASYETAATTCGKVLDDAQRKTCQDGAYAGYKTCKESCQQSDTNDCKERCKQLCDAIHDACHANCTKNNPTPSCHAKCNDEYGACLKKCDQDCKGN